MTRVAVRFDEVGWRTTLQDLGRVGSERLGVPRGGAADQGAARVAGILVGNPQSAPLIESLGGAISLSASTDVLVAVTGSVGAVFIDDCLVGSEQPLALPGGARLRVECGTHAARTYVAIGGIIESPRFLGSVAPDTRMGFTQAISVGSSIAVDTGVTRIDHPALGRCLFCLPLPTRALPVGNWVIDLVDCAETDEIPGIRDLLAESTYIVDTRSDHVGIRLDGPVLHPPQPGEILSHGVPIGAVEVPHSDELIVLGRYRTLTAGYPIVGFATRRAQDVVGQARPGREVGFRWVERSAARLRALRFEAEIAELEAAAMGAFAALDLAVAAAKPHCGRPFKVRDLSHTRKAS